MKYLTFTMQKKKTFSIIFSFRFSVGPPLVAPWGPKNLWSKALYM